MDKETEKTLREEILKLRSLLKELEQEKVIEKITVESVYFYYIAPT